MLMPFLFELAMDSVVNFLPHTHEEAVYFFPLFLSSPEGHEF